MRSRRRIASTRMRCARGRITSSTRCKTRSPGHSSILPTCGSPTASVRGCWTIARHGATDQLRPRRRVTALDENAEENLAAGGPESVADQVRGCVARLSRPDAVAVTMVTSRLRAGARGGRPGDEAGHGQGDRARGPVAFPPLGCAEFRDLSDEDPPAASRHIGACLERAGAQVLPLEVASASVRRG
jgi:hypothetical protein